MEVCMFCHAPNASKVYTKKFNGTPRIRTPIGGSGATADSVIVGSPGHTFAGRRLALPGHITASSSATDNRFAQDPILRATN
jgi:hypothetical protein